MQALIDFVAWHTGQTCAEYDILRKERMEQEAASEALIAKVAKGAPNNFRLINVRNQVANDPLSIVCPNTKCGHGIVKHGGCDHMTCKSIPQIFSL